MPEKLFHFIIAPIIGYFVGWLLHYPLGFAWALVSRGPEEAFKSWGDVFPNLKFAGAIIAITGVAIVYGCEELANARNARKRAEDDDAEKKRLAKEAAAQYKRDLEAQASQLRQYSRTAAGVTLETPAVLGQAELALNRAEEEFEEGYFSPFWEAIEEATDCLREFDERIHRITGLYQSFKLVAPKLGDAAPAFTIQSELIPDPNPTHERLRQLYRKAQKIASFAQIYEQRRQVTEQRRTNALLKAGFASLGDAIHQIGSRINDALDELRRDVGFRLGDMQQSLENAATNAKQQRDALLAELHSSNLSDRENVKREADQRRDYEQKSLKMLDNLQRGKRPFP